MGCHYQVTEITKVPTAMGRTAERGGWGRGRDERVERGKRGGKERGRKKISGSRARGMEEERGGEGMKEKAETSFWPAG